MRIYKQVLKVKIKNRSSNPLPTYKTKWAAGFDVQAFLTENLVLVPRERVLIPTGLYFEIAEGYEAQVRPRSGLALNNGITVLNSPGTIDADYRGEVKIILINHGNEAFTITNGMRIAQIIIAPCVQALLVEVESLSDTERGAGGFGHTGLT